MKVWCYISSTFETSTPLKKSIDRFYEHLIIYYSKALRTHKSFQKNNSSFIFFDDNKAVLTQHHSSVQTGEDGRPNVLTFRYGTYILYVWGYNCMPGLRKCSARYRGIGPLRVTEEAEWVWVSMIVTLPSASPRVGEVICLPKGHHQFHTSKSSLQPNLADEQCCVRSPKNNYFARSDEVLDKMAEVWLQIISRR